MVRAPVTDQEVSVLKALVLGLCALALLAQSAAAGATRERAATGASHAKAGKPTTEERARLARRKLAVKVDAARKLRRTIRSYEFHRALTRSGSTRAEARIAMRRAQRALARTTREISYYRGLVRLWEERQRAIRLQGAPPRTAICGVFRRYCGQAVAVAWCESRLSPAARNGQYRGLFQMGSHERRLFGHGPTAYEQAVAAHRYFVHSGRDWSPWSCRWAAA